MAGLGSSRCEYIKELIDPFQLSVSALGFVSSFLSCKALSRMRLLSTFVLGLVAGRAAAECPYAERAKEARSCPYASAHAAKRDDAPVQRRQAISGKEGIFY